MALTEIQIIDPFLDALVQHIAIKDPKLYQALTTKKTITLDLSTLFADVIVHSLKTADVGQRVEIDGTHGVRIFDALNNVNVQLNGSALTIKTAATGQRLELDPTNGLTVYNSAGVLQSQFLGTTVTLPASVITTQNLINDAVTNIKIATDAVHSAQVQDLAIIAGKLAANSVTAANIQAGQVTAVKIAVSQLSAISADLGSITAGTITSITLASNTITGGTITGTTFKTAVSGLRVEIDSTNGLRIYDAGGTLTAQLNGSSLTFGAGLIDGSALTNSTITAGKLNVSTLSAISANLGTITAGSIDSNTITGGTITGTTVTGGIVQTAVVGNNRVYMDSTNGLLLLDSSDVTHVQINASVYAGILLNGLRSIDTNDIFMEANDQSVQLFVSQASGRVSFAMAGATRGYFDSSDGSGAGNQPTSLVVRVNGALQRVNRASSGGFLYI